MRYFGDICALLNQLCYKFSSQLQALSPTYFCTDLFEGDIVLDADERRAIFSTNLDEQAYIRDAVIQKDYRWPKNTMYYVMDANLSES